MEKSSPKKLDYIESKKSKTLDSISAAKSDLEDFKSNFLEAGKKREICVASCKERINSAIASERKKIIANAKKKAFSMAMKLEGYNEFRFVLFFVPLVFLYFSVFLAILSYVALVAFNYQKCVKLLSSEKILGLNDLEKSDFNYSFTTKFLNPTDDEASIRYWAPNVEYKDKNDLSHSDIFWIDSKEKTGTADRHNAILYKSKDGLILEIVRTENGVFIDRNVSFGDNGNYIAEFAKTIDYKFDEINSVFLEMHEFINKIRQINSQIATLEKRLESLENFEKIWDGVALDIETLDSILKRVDMFVAGNVVAPKGILLYGPPGTGKSLIAKNISKSIKCAFYAVSVAELKGKHVGHTGPLVKEIWDKALANKPSIIFVDECDTVFKGRGNLNSDSFGDELVNTFIQKWDGLGDSSGVLVIGATNRREDIDAAVLSRFNTVIEIPLPNAQSREKIIRTQFEKIGLTMDDWSSAVKETMGLSGRDIQNLVSSLAMDSIVGKVTEQEIIQAIRLCRSKSSTSVSEATWDDIVVDKEFKSKLEILSKTIKSAEVLESKGISVPKSMILYGPPGTGKTQIAKVLANESGLAFISATTADLKAGYLGQSVQRTKELFEKARSQSPCILFIDEIDIVAPSRGEGGDDKFTQEVVGQLLQEMDGFAKRSGRLFVMAATNSLESIDPAIKSRFQEKIEVPLPSAENRFKILELNFTGKPCSFDVKNVTQKIVENTEGFSGRDLVSFVSKVEKNAVARHIGSGDEVSELTIEQSDVDKALCEV